MDETGRRLNRVRTESRHRALKGFREETKARCGEGIGEKRNVETIGAPKA